MSKADWQPEAGQLSLPKLENLSVAILYPGDRVDKMNIPLQASRMEVDVEPDDAFDRDIVICDNADRDLGKEVLRNRLTKSQLVYRMRGDVFYELDLWDMHPVKHWAATRIVLPNVDGVIAVSDRLAEKYQAKTGLNQVDSAGMSKNVSAWPTVTHSDSELRIVTLTNANYWEKVKPIVEWAKPVNNVLDETGGTWRVCGRGKHTAQLKDALEGYDHVEWAGYVDAYEELRTANLMLHPSYLDGQPNSVLEGMASNLPVITNDFAAFVRYEGPLTVVHSQTALHAKLMAYTDPEYRTEDGEANMHYVQEHHSAQAIAQDYERFCFNLIHNDAN